jgi:hypothetical protein
MGDERDDDRSQGPRDGGQRTGPEGAGFLHLEVSRWLESEARGTGDDLMREMLRSAIRARLEERIGAQLRAVGAAIADEIADDFDANLAIEALIDGRRDARKAAVERAQQTMRDASSAKAPKKKRA